MLVYVAGPYRGDVDKNIAAARKIAIELWEKDHAVICPHTNTAHFEDVCDVSDETYLKGDLAILARCDAVVVAPNHQESEGTLMEIAFAKQRKIPIYYYPDLPERHPTEVKFPKQSAGFMDIIMQMYRVHLDKNADYSPANVLGPGEVGLATRVWDKAVRIMNLNGIEVVASDGRYSPTLKLFLDFWEGVQKIIRRAGFLIVVPFFRFKVAEEPKNESLEDSLCDMSVYLIIWRLLRRGLWGR